MALENAKKFLEQVLKDEALRARMAEMGPAEVAAVAEELGFGVTAEELNLEEMSQAAGGWEFHTEGKYHTWLNGYEVKCPFCGNASPDVVKRIGASPSEVAFICDACVKSFFLRWNRLYNKVNVITY